MPIDVPTTFKTPLDKLKWIMRALRDKDHGCPWNLKQSYETIAPHTIEEAYEVVDAIENGTKDDLKEELGDLLFQVIYYTQLSSEDSLFDFNDVTNQVTDKMISRHPHVFGDVILDDTNDIHDVWETQKSKEKDSNSVLDNITRALPALLRAQKIQKKAAKTGFEWQNTEQALDKFNEELQEFQEAETDADKEEEFGDMLFALVNYGRMNGIHTEEALRKANEKFINRFQKMEKATDLKSLSLDEMLKTWQEAKKSA